MPRSIGRPTCAPARRSRGSARDTLAVVQDDASFVAILEDVGEPAPLRLARARRTASVGRRRSPVRRRARQQEREARSRGRASRSTTERCSSRSARARRPSRERVVLVDDPAAARRASRIVERSALYAAMRDERSILAAPSSTSKAPRSRVTTSSSSSVATARRADGRAPVDATARIDRARSSRTCVRSRARDARRAHRCATSCSGTSARSTARGSRSPTARDARTAMRPRFLACAEDSPDATRDGPVTRRRHRTPRRSRDASRELGAIVDERGDAAARQGRGPRASTTMTPRARGWSSTATIPTCPAELLELRLGERMGMTDGRADCRGRDRRVAAVPADVLLRERASSSSSGSRTTASTSGSRSTSRTSSKMTDIEVGIVLGNFRLVGIARADPVRRDRRSHHVQAIADHRVRRLRDGVLVPPRVPDASVRHPRARSSRRSQAAS